MTNSERDELIATIRRLEAQVHELKMQIEVLKTQQANTREALYRF